MEDPSFTVELSENDEDFAWRVLDSQLGLVAWPLSELLTQA